MRRYLAVGLVVCVAFALWPCAAGGFASSNTLVSRAFSQTTVAEDEAVTVTLTVTNLEAVALRGFYFADHLPTGLSVETASVKIDDSGVSDYFFESSTAWGVYPSCRAARWVLETPTTFTQDNPVDPASTLEIVYSITAAAPGTYELNEFSWAGYYEEGGGQSAFGYSENEDKQTVDFVGATPTPEPTATPMSGATPENWFLYD